MTSNPRFPKVEIIFEQDARRRSFTCQPSYEYMSGLTIYFIL